jgi:hypothetical protein
MRFEATASRIWKALSREDRRKAADAFLKEPIPELYAAALGAIVRVRRMRPQAARSLPLPEQAATLASLSDPGEALAGSLLVGLHLAERRPLLGAFLDALGLPHEDGVMKEEADATSVDAARVEAAARDLAERYPKDQVATYFNVLLLQDPERWEPLRKAEAFL